MATAVPPNRSEGEYEHVTDHHTINAILSELQSAPAADPLPAQAGNAGKFLTTDGSATSWAAASSGGGSWGSITGTLSAQTDLNAALAAKADSAVAMTTDTPQTVTGVKSFNSGALKLNGATIESVYAPLSALPPYWQWTTHMPTGPSTSGMTVFGLSTTIYGGFTYTTTGTSGTYVDFPMTLAPGTYTLRMIAPKDTNRGIVKVSFDAGSTTLGTTVDLYAGSASYNNLIDITGITIAGGAMTMRLLSNTKHASSSGYYIGWNGLAMIRTGA